MAFGFPRGSGRYFVASELDCEPIAEFGVSVIENEPTIRHFAESSIITILVGPDEHKLFVHKDLLCKHSEFFKKCLTTSFAEAESHMVKLEEDDPSAFVAIVDWMYSQPLLGLRADSNCSEAKFCILIKAYILADKLCMDECRNAIIDRIRYHLVVPFGNVTNIIPADAIDTLTQIDIPNTLPLRRFFVERIAWDIANDRYFDKSTQQLKNIYRKLLYTGGELAVDVFQQLHANKLKDTKEDPAAKKGCAYHIHQKGAQCPKTSLSTSGVFGSGRAPGTFDFSPPAAQAQVRMWRD